MDADRDGGAPRRRRSRTAPTGAGPATARVRASGWVPSFGGVGQKRPLAEGRGAAAEPVTGDGSGDEPSGGDEDALRDDDDDAVPLSVAELYHEDDEDARPARESRDESVRQYEAAFVELDTSNAPPEAHPVCPVCALRLADVADTPLARVAHVNACLDGATYGHSVGGAGALAEERNADARGECRRRRVGARRGGGPSAFAEALVRCRVTFEGLARASDADLRAMGVATLGAGKRPRDYAVRARERAALSEPFADDGVAATASSRGIHSQNVGNTEHRTQNVPTKDRLALGWHPTRIASAVAPVFRGFAAGSSARSDERAQKKASSRREALALPRRTRGDAAPRAGASRYVPAADADPPPPPGSACPARGSSWTGSRATARATRVGARTGSCRTSTPTTTRASPSRRPIQNAASSGARGRPPSCAARGWAFRRSVCGSSTWGGRSWSRASRCASWTPTTARAR